MNPVNATQTHVNIGLLYIYIYIYQFSECMYFRFTLRLHETK